MTWCGIWTLLTWIISNHIMIPCNRGRFILQVSCFFVVSTVARSVRINCTAHTFIPSVSKSTPLRLWHRNRRGVKCEELKKILKMGFKFSIICGIFQVLLVILFSVLVDYGQHASPPHKRKGSAGSVVNSSETLAVNDVTVYYSSKGFL